MLLLLVSNDIGWSNNFATLLPFNTTFTPGKPFSNTAKIEKVATVFQSGNDVLATFSHNLSLSKSEKF
jgi:hypothetical protein